MVVEFDLKASTLSVLTTQSGRAFHRFMTLCENKKLSLSCKRHLEKLSLSCKRHLGLRIFNLWSIGGSLLTLKNFSALI